MGLYGKGWVAGFNPLRFCREILGGSPRGGLGSGLPRRGPWAIPAEKRHGPRIFAGAGTSRPRARPTPVRPVPEPAMRLLSAVLLAVLCLAGLTAAAVSSVDGSDPAPPPRYLTHLSVDRPVVRPGETLRVRGVLLDALTREPADADEPVSASWEVADARGSVVARGWTETVDGVLGAAWEVPAGLDGGRYTLKAAYPSSGHPPAERTFEVRAFRAPTLKTVVAFLRDGHGPGDTVAASLAVENAEGGPPPTNTTVTAVARLDGAEIFRGPVALNDGLGRVSFDLPAEIARGEGSLSFLVNAGGGVETTTRTLPILLQTLDLAFFPEGGVLAAGLPGRVYLEARTPWGDPADLVGRLVDAGTGEPVGAEGAAVEVSTTHEGRGVFAFTPVAGRTYSLEIVEPAGLDARFPLPAVEEAAAVLRPVAERFDAGEAVGFRLVVADPAAPLRVELASRERVVGVVAFAEGLGAATADVRFEPPADADGVLRATVFDGDGRPVAERLVFREPARKLRVEVVPGSASAVPGGEVELSVRTVDAATGEPVAAGVGITVTDDAELSVVQRRDTHPRLPAMALLESELVLAGGLKDPGAYLGGDAEADAALDLLLATRGWRRFAFVDPAAFVAEHGDAARRVLGQREEPAMRRLRREAAFLGAAVPMAAAAVAVLAEEPMEPEEPMAAALPGGVAGEAAEALLDDRLVRGDLDAADRAAGSAFLAMRTYAHPPPQVAAEGGPRTDRTATVFFADRVQTDADGRAAVRFHTSGRVTGLRVLADAVDARGAFGAADTLLPTVLPFSLSLTLPAEVNEGDELVLEVAAANRTGKVVGATLNRPRIEGPAELLDAQSAGAVKLILPANGRVSVSHRLRITGPGEVTITLAGDSSAGSDSLTRTLTTAPRGFPVAIARGGMLAADGAAEHTITVPADAVHGSLVATVEVFPTPAGNLTAGLEGLLRQPSGCFEQTSSTSYPLVMAQRYFLGHADTDPALIQRSAALLDGAYAKLTGFETPERGYEWFGAAPGHAALTAYGLMQFVEMGEVRNVDPAMVARTRAWLLSRRDGDGGFKPDGKALDSFGGARRHDGRLHHLGARPRGSGRARRRARSCGGAGGLDQRPLHRRARRRCSR